MGEFDAPPLLSLPAALSTLLAPLDSIANGWGGIPMIDVSATALFLLHRVTHMSLFDVHVSRSLPTRSIPSAPLIPLLSFLSPLPLPSDIS